MKIALLDLPAALIFFNAEIIQNNQYLSGACSVKLKAFV